MPKFIKKPIMIEAVQWNGNNFDEIRKLIVEKHANRAISVNPDNTLIIRTLEGNMIANLTDWISKDVKSELYPCKNDIFMATYEGVKNPIDVS
jgi:hypothetical protein